MQTASDFIAICLLLMVALFIGVFVGAVAMGRTVLPPNPLDAAFVSDDEAEVTKAIQDNPAFKKAIRAAMAQKAQTVEDRKKQPIGPLPEQQARVRFLEVLNNQEK